MMFTAMLTDVFYGSEAGIKIRYRMNGKLFNQRRYHAVAKMNDNVLREFFSPTIAG